MGFRQSTYIRDSVFPLAEAFPNGDGFHNIGHLGTGFLIGSSGWALTAGHVLAGVREAYALFAGDDGKWFPAHLAHIEPHPTEDLALIRLTGEGWSSIFDLEPIDVRASFDYALWGYPSDVLHEGTHRGRVVPRPDLVYSAGHVRRMIYDMTLPKIRGALLAELSTAAGSGCSGAPILGAGRRHSWSVTGIYLGERVSDGVQVGYSNQTSSFGDWAPDILGRSLRAEASDTKPLPEAD